MKVYTAISPSRIYFDMLKECNQENCLVSYAFAKNARKLLEVMNGYIPKNLILDSGAFSVWSKGDTVDIDAYAQFCLDVKELFPKKINIYVVNLDVLPGKFGERPSQQQREESAQQGWNNMLYLEAKGLKVIHVFHQHEDWAWLDKIRAHSDYIGISPANDVSMKEKEKWMNKVYSIITDTVKTHGFAVTSHTQLYKYPLYSADSSSWTAPARFGRIPIFCDDNTIKSIDYKNKEDILKYWKYISAVGIQKIADIDYSFRVKMAIRTFQKLQEVATKLWTLRGVVWKD